MSNKESVSGGQSLADSDSQAQTQTQKNGF